jgi:CHAT domain-containing protein
VIRFWHLLRLLAGFAGLSIQITPAPVIAETFRRELYNPAILSLSFNEQPQSAGAAAAQAVAFLDLTLISRQGDPVGRRVQLSRERFRTELRNLYQQIARQESLNLDDPSAPARQLYAALIAPVEPLLREQGVTSLLIAADRGLQAVPFAALHDGSGFFGQRYAFAITPSVRFTSLGPPRVGSQRLLAAGASSFPGLAPLPLVPQEIQGLAKERPTDQFLNRAFTPNVLLSQVADSRYDRVHVASHADFQPGGPSQATLHTGTGTISLPQFLAMRERRSGNPLELFSLSACRTALGDSDTELGFAGLALQAGSRSAIGTLWYVDDVATSAYFLQLYRYLDRGMPKAEALQATRAAMISGELHLQADQLIGADGRPLLSGLTPVQQRRIASGMKHPFFWAGIELIGTPW